MEYFKFIKLFITLVILVVATAATTVNNPIIWADVPDPDIIRVDDTYYMVSTTMYFTPGAPIMKSKDLVSWEIVTYTCDILANGDVQTLSRGQHDYSHGSWAASLRYNKGIFYVFFGSYGTNKSYIFKTKDIESGKWERFEINGMYHDASILFDDDGRNYLVYGGGGEIKIKEFNAEMTNFKWGGLDKTLFRTNLSGLAGEGSHVMKINGYYYVFIIAWPSGKGRIEICYRSKDLTGYYENKTVLDSGLGSYGSGVAQGGIVDTPDGKKWFGLLFQDHGAVGRIPVLVPVNWQNGWPMMGVNGKAPLTLQIDGGFKGSKLAKSDDFNYDSNHLDLVWQWNHNPDNSAWSVTERPGWLRLKNKHVASEILKARNTLTMRTEGPACSSVVKLDVTNLKVGDYAGLSAFQYNYGNVGVYVADNGEKRIYMASNGNTNGDVIKDSRNNIVQETKLNGNEVYLKLDFRFSNVERDGSASWNIDKVNFYYSYDGSKWTKIGKEIGMTYDLKLFTGYRSGLFSYPTKNTGGYADFDFFKYEREKWNQGTIASDDDTKTVYPGNQESNQGNNNDQNQATPSSGDIKDGNYYIKSNFANKYLVVRDGRGANAQNVEIGSTKQKWKITNNDDGTVYIVSEFGNFSLDVDRGSGDNGANIQIYSHHGGEAQKFIIRETNQSGVYVIDTQASNGYRALDVEGERTSEGTNVCQWDDSGKSNQTWTFESADPKSNSDSSNNDNKNQNNNTTSCWSKALGYTCCSTCTSVIDSDASGDWGIENGEWCGIPESCSKSNATCKGAQGYPCCQKTCEVYSTDSDGSWSIENNDWCLIDKSKC